MAIQPDSLLASLPARYSKFITVLIGLFITYVAIYGWVWHLEPALIMIGTALGVYGVPNGPPPAIPVPVPVSETVIEDVPLPEPAPAPVQPAPVPPAPAPVPAQPPPGFNPPAPPHA